MAIKRSESLYLVRKFKVVFMEKTRKLLSLKVKRDEREFLVTIKNILTIVILLLSFLPGYSQGRIIALWIQHP